MTPEKLYSPEQFPQPVLVAPPAESLQKPDRPDSPWPETIRENPKLKEQAELRLRLHETLDQIFDILPLETNIETAIDTNLIHPDDAANLFNKISKLLRSDHLNNRILLYIPFELIPSSEYNAPTSELASALSYFKNTLIDSWYDLLSFNDVRANFVDGDVIEVELRETMPLKRVTKAIHLAPALIEKGILTTDHIVELMRDNPNSVLEKTIAETLEVLVDMNLFDIQALDALRQERPQAFIREADPTLNEKDVSPNRARWLEQKKKESEQPEQLGATPPKLDATFDESREKIKAESTAMESLITAIETHPELSQYIYPVTIMFGSRMKGYGTSTSDLDYAVFIKPGTDISERGKIQSLLSEAISETTLDQGFEFWLETTDGVTMVKDFENPDTHLADSTWTHVLFEGAWFGNKDIIEDLHKNVLSEYLYSEGKMIGQIEARKVWLKEMEKDTLQYRLLHKGYDRYYAPHGRITTPHADLIDGSSAFYDSGYRRIATQLFIQKVFLPQLKHQA